MITELLSIVQLDWNSVESTDPQEVKRTLTGSRKKKIKVSIWFSSIIASGHSMSPSSTFAVSTQRNRR